MIQRLFKYVSLTFERILNIWSCISTMDTRVIQNIREIFDYSWFFKQREYQKFVSYFIELWKLGEIEYIGVWRNSVCLKLVLHMRYRYADYPKYQTNLESFKILCTKSVSKIYLSFYRVTWDRRDKIYVYLKKFTMSEASP